MLRCQRCLSVPASTLWSHGQRTAHPGPLQGRLVSGLRDRSTANGLVASRTVSATSPLCACAWAALLGGRLGVGTRRGERGDCILAGISCGGEGIANMPVTVPRPSGPGHPARRRFSACRHGDRRCVVEYTIDAAKTGAFERFARTWIGLGTSTAAPATVTSCRAKGRTTEPSRYSRFLRLPTTSPTDRCSGLDPEFVAADDIGEASGCVLR
jgi:hypothetical protein